MVKIMKNDLILIPSLIPILDQRWKAVHKSYFHYL